MRVSRFRIALLALVVLAACETTDTSRGVVVGNDGVGVRAANERVAAQVGPDDSAVVVSGDRVAVGADTDETVADYRIGNSTAAVRARNERGRGTFGGLGFGF